MVKECINSTWCFSAESVQGVHDDEDSFLFSLKKLTSREVEVNSDADVPVKFSIQIQACF